MFLFSPSDSFHAILFVAVPLPLISPHGTRILCCLFCRKRLGYARTRLGNCFFLLQRLSLQKRGCIVRLYDLQLGDYFSKLPPSVYCAVLCFPGMGFELLPDLQLRARRATICVRVARKWEYRGGTDDGPVQHVDLVIIDHKGNSMYAEIPGNEVESKSQSVQEGSIYVISRFRVSNAKHSFRPVDSNLMVEFTCDTQVSPAREEMVGFPLYTYRLTPIDGLKARAGDTRDFVDTIGVLTEVSDSYMVQLPNKPRPTLTRHLILRDLSYSEMKVSLWGERAAAFTMEQVPNQADGKPVVLLMVGGLMKRFQDVYYLSANTAARWYFNPAIPEAREFYSSFQDQRVDIKRVAAPIQPEGPVRIIVT